MGGLHLSSFILALRYTRVRLEESALNIIKKRNGPITVLDVEGVIKLGESAREFARYLDTVLQDESGPVIINFEKINYMDSTGLGELVGYLQKFEERRRPLVLVKPSQRIRALLELTKLGGLFEIFDSEEDAAEELLR